MSERRPPGYESRRGRELEAELLARARAWIPSWGLEDDRQDFGRALLGIAARFGAEVTERLDRAGEKTALGFLDWLAVRGEAARPARLPVVFRLTDSARAAKPAPARSRLQVEAAGVSVILETETDVLLLPRGLRAVVGTDNLADAFFLAPPGLSDLAPLAALPTRWQLKSFAAAGATQVQLDPELGLAPDAIVELDGRQYRVVRVEEDIVTLDPPLARGQAARTPVRKVTAFMPFDGAADNRQEHALYLGHKELFAIEAAATIGITGGGTLPGVAWHYWGKRAPDERTGWQSLETAPEQPWSDGIVLVKPPGPMELLDLGKGGASRWLRASVATLQPDQAPLSVDAFGIRINCAAGVRQPCDAAAAAAPAAQGMANTTPLVLGNVFYPLGKEPRQFDAFYLGSQEAFSKKGAAVRLQFEMAALNFRSLTASHGGAQARPFVAGVPADGQLHLFDIAPDDGKLTRRAGRGPLRPPTPAPPNAPAPQDNRSVALDARPAFRIPVWRTPGGNAIAVTANGAVWIWYESSAAGDIGGWTPAGIVDPAAGPTQAIAGLVYLADNPSGLLVALRGGALFVHELEPADGKWQPVEVSWKKEGTGVAGMPPQAEATAVSLARIAAVGRDNGEPGNGTRADGLVGISTTGKLFGIALSRGTDGALQAHCTRLLDAVAGSVAPLAVRDAANRLVAVAVKHDEPRLLAFQSRPGTFERDAGNDVALVPEPVIGALFDVGFDAGTPTLVAAVGDAEATALVSWQPFAPDGMTPLLEVPIPATLGALAGAPTLVARHVLVPMSANQVLAKPFDVARHAGGPAALSTAIVARNSVEHLAVGDRLALPLQGPGGAPRYRLQQVADPVLEQPGLALHEFSVHAIDAPVFVYRRGADHETGFDPLAPREVALHADDPVPPDGALLLVTTNASTQLYPVAGFDPVTHVATLERALDVAEPAPETVTYTAPQPCHALVRPMLRIDAGAVPGAPATLRLIFPAARPERQTATVYAPAAGASRLAVLGAHWQRKPPVVAGKVQFLIEDDTTDWLPQLGDASTNPELSWEYWNGKGWWQFDRTVDGTLALKRSGIVQFDVPDDIAPSDWAGQSNYWIRARLIGGDYGREEVTVDTTDLGGEPRKTSQVVRRSNEGIRAPSVARLCIGYSMCRDVAPELVLVRDSGTVRDQSDANRTDGARVEAFVPLARLLDRLSGQGPVAAADAGVARCCDAAPATASGASETEGAAAPARALYLGFDAPLLGEPINVLLLVEEREHGRQAPLGVAALVADRFVPVTASDTTRALGESGVLSLALPVAPTPRELFGQTLSWLRLAPAAGTASPEWRPKILAACLNGVWASAAETLTRELIGSSQGEPGLTLYLARPPVLRNTLELRVREPLGDEELDELRGADAARVLTGLDNLPGSWVLWRQVLDPGDERPDARVYALDEATGEIRFGDGRHGRIPPIGRDAILAVTYRRAEPGQPGSLMVPGNAIAARMPLNLVSPIDGVEAVYAADQAAGGAAAQEVAVAARFGTAALRHRERVLTARDVEDLVLASSPDIAQARCFPRPGHVQLIVVMRGADPVPTAARRRELERILLPLASPLLGAAGTLRIQGPALRPLRVELILGVASLDDAGAVARAARRRIAALFDPGTGGMDGKGWPLGAVPVEADVAYVLASVSGLTGIIHIDWQAVDEEGAALPFAVASARAGLPVLVPDGVRVAFETSGRNP